MPLAPNTPEKAMTTSKLEPNTIVVFKGNVAGGGNVGVSLRLFLEGDDRQRLHSDFIENRGRQTYTDHFHGGIPRLVSIDLRDVSYIR
jgi:hypothetical protein